MEPNAANPDTIIKEFKSSLSDLVVNSRPLINMLTMLADENVAVAPAIVEAVEMHLLKAPPESKLPVMYLMDNICKTVKKTYVDLFMPNLVTNFCAVFEKVDEKIRASLYKLRSTWNEIFPATKLYALDSRVKMIDPAWPIPALPNKALKSGSIHVNPRFLNDGSQTTRKETANGSRLMNEIMVKKQQELSELQKKSRSLLESKSILDGQMHLGNLVLPGVAPVLSIVTDTASFIPKSTGHAPLSTQSILLKPSAAAQRTIIRPATIPAARPSAIEPQFSLNQNKDPRLAKTPISQVQRSNLHSAKDNSNLRPDKISSFDVVVIPDSTKSSPKSSKSLGKRESSHKKESNGKDDSKRNSKSSSRSSSSSSSASSPSKAIKSSKGSKKDTKSSKKAAVPDGKFKEIKNIHIRNYIRKARSVSSSPEPPSSEAKREAVSKSSNQTPEQDVDLRRLASSPTGKKRGSTPDKGADQPPSPKKSKQAEMMDELFGREDVDLRQMSAPDRAELKKAPDWARFKQTNPDTYRSPLKNCWENGSDISLSDIEIAPPPPMPKIIIPEENKISPGMRKSNDFDSLGRPLLHCRLSGETRERRRSSSITEDIDLRPMFSDLNEGQETNEKISLMISQADEQLKNGTMNISDYRALLKQVVQMNEASKLREAQRRDEQENWSDTNFWPEEDSQDSGKASPDDKMSKDDTERRHRKRDDARKHNDVDERFLQRREYHHRGRGGNFMRGRGGSWGEGHMQRPQWDDNWNRQGGPTRPPFMRGGPRGHFPRGGMPGDFGGARFWNMGPRPGQFQSPFPPMHQGIRTGLKGADLPPPDPRDLEIARSNFYRTLSIDGMPRDIRHYGDNTIVLISWDDPRDISFFDGERQVEFENGPKIVCKLNGGYEDVLINGMIHKVKLGVPSRELYIDGKDYECYFGGNPVVVELNGINTRVQLEGPVPNVNIGKERRADFCAGKINLVVDAVHMIPVYLDASPQIFHIDGVPHILKFIEAFRRVSINGQKFAFEYGGLPQQIFVHNQRHYIGFTSLPPWVKPGYITIYNMEGGRLPSPPREEKPLPMMPEKVAPAEPEGHAPALPMVGAAKAKKIEKSTSAQEPRKTPLSRSILNTKPQLDVLTNLIPGTSSTTSSGYDYKVQKDKELEKDKAPEASDVVAPDLAQLLAKLNEYGILQSVNATEAKKKEEAEKKEEIYDPVKFTSESLKMRRSGSYAPLYCGIQCSTCGLRFPPEQTLKYSQHLDWHFRQNRREKDSAKKAQSRKWYYDVSDWIQFEEIEDLEERAQSWFETQEEDKPEEVETEIPTVLAGDNNCCGMCHELFEQFYNNEKDEWHFRDAIRVEEKVFHPHCYQDLQNAMETTADSNADEATEISGTADVEMNDSVKGEEADTPVEEKDAVVKIDETEKTLDVPLTEPLAEPMEQEPPQQDLKGELPNQTEVLIKSEPMDTEPITAESEPQEEKDENKDSGVFSQETDPEVHVKEEPPEEEEEATVPPTALPEVDTTIKEVKSTIDGNVELEEAPAAAPAPLNKIKINMTTPAPAAREPVAKIEEPDTPLEETDEPLQLRKPKEDDFELKPKLKGRKLQEMPPVMKGREDSALCTIM